MDTLPTVTLEFLMARYEALLLDAYGVLVSFEGALPGAGACIERLNRADKAYFLVSNTAARSPEHAAVRYRRFGLDIPPERILTSGMLLGPHFAAHGLAGRRVLVFGPDDSMAYVAEAGGLPVAPGQDYEAVVLADQAVFNLADALDWLLSTLFAKLDGGEAVPLILPNPDLVYPTGRGWAITAGSLAVMIEAALAQRYPGPDCPGFTRLGKPHSALFDLAVQRAGTRNVVMIGDQLETDIQGANDFGIDSAFVPGGVLAHGSVLPPSGPRPTWLLPGLAP